MMNPSQLFFDQRTPYDQPFNKFQKCENVSTEVPDAPLSFEAPLLPSQRFLGDIQASQLYQNSQRSHGQNQTGRLQETKHYSNYDLDLPVSQNYVPDILASQLYHNNQLEKDNSYHEKAGRGIANVRSGYKSDGLEKQSVNIILPKKTSRDMFKVQRMKDVDSTVEEKRTNFLHPDLAQQNVLEQTGKRKRFISPITPFFSHVSKAPKLPNGKENIGHTQKEAETPERVTAYKNKGRNPCFEKDAIPTPLPLLLPSSHGIKLRSREEISERYRDIFEFPYFNIVQSKVFDEVFYTDKPLVVCAPTGAGKTALFELAIVRLMMKMENSPRKNFKVVYMAPIKALCSEKYTSWKEKFEPHNLKCAELTGDTEVDDYYELQEVNIILTTPEKWDSMTRRWRDNTCFVQSVCLFCIDEIHVLNDSTRGATIEAVISRMKTIQAAIGRSSVENFLPKLRFVAVSATIPNIDDIAEWLGESEPAISVKMDDSLRPVRLRKVVLGFYFDEHKGSAFHFDMSLNYKLAGIINTYSDDRPTLVFCSTRKSTQQAGEILAKDSRGTMIKTAQQRQKLMKYANMVKDNKLRDLVMKGIGFHHAGMDIQDRKYMEELFAAGDLFVLVATSTLAMGVNLPAHLVILKSTQYYNMGCHEEYSDTQILQMIGRAGRPQFDTTATAVIMTKNQTKAKYENLLNGTQVIESSLHKHLVEHLNAEIVLNTINDISIAMEWIRYTFLYIRVMKNPKHYGIPLGLTKEQIEKRLQDLCMKSLNELEMTKMITMDEETFDVKPTEAGRLMARYCIAFETMKKFCKISGVETICELITLVADCEEFTEIQLRTNEKKTLNSLNKDKNRITIRFPIVGKIKTKQMKVNVLIQAALGCLMVQDFSLQQDTTRIFRAANRISRCLLELLWLRNDFKALLSSVQIMKSFRARLWEDSKYVTKQLDGIGPTLSNALVNAGITSFQKIEDTNPRELELIVNRHPPFGNQVRDSVAGLPKYELTIEQVAKYSNSSSDLWIHLTIANKEQLQDKKTMSPYHTCVLIIGDEDNKIVYQRKIMDSYLLKDNGITKKIEVKRANKGPELNINLISQDWVGIDVQSTYTPFYNGPKKMSSSNSDTQNKPYSRLALVDNQKKTDQLQDLPSLQRRVPCNHSCMNKRLCGHDCCRNGVIPKTKKTPQTPQSTGKEVKRPNTFNNFMSDLKSKMSYFPETPKKKRLMMSGNVKDIDLNQFAYNPNPSLSHPTVPQTPKPARNQNMASQNYYTPQVGKSRLNTFLTTPQNPQGNQSYNCQIGGDRSDDLDLERCFNDDDYIDEMGDANVDERWAKNESKRNLCVNGEISGYCQDDYGKEVNGRAGIEEDIHLNNGNNFDVNMDWPELEMYQKKREENLEDYEYELPDLDVNENENFSRSEYQPADFEIQSSLLPTQYGQNNRTPNQYLRDGRGSYNEFHKEQQDSCDLPQLHYTGGTSRQPHTPHRYGQVLAWSNTSRNGSPEWSGSDNEIVNADTPPSSSSMLLYRSKEILNKHVEAISSKPRTKKMTNSAQYQPKGQMSNQGLYQARQHASNKNETKQKILSSDSTFIKQQEFNPSLSQHKWNMPNNSLHQTKHKQDSNINHVNYNVEPNVPQQESGEQNKRGKFTAEKYLKEHAENQVNTYLKGDQFTMAESCQNKQNSAIPCQQLSSRNDERKYSEVQKSIPNFFSPESQFKSAMDNKQSTPLDTFNSIFDGIF
ncbi:probable ATP-dependent DNA helicase HFM1 [Mytilus edulis]|uniref:probable ATP-dependent DNA helicase HFM1 n=1 Tax=Mytilus edulis TaxID=6550 RepID=UPI0039F0B191